MYTKEDLDNVIDFIVYQKLNACESESSRNYLQLFLDNCKVENDDAFTEKVFKLAIKYPNLVELSKDLHCDVMRLQKIIFYQQIDDKTIQALRNSNRLSICIKALRRFSCGAKLIYS